MADLSSEEDDHSMVISGPWGAQGGPAVPDSSAARPGRVSRRLRRRKRGIATVALTAIVAMVATVGLSASPARAATAPAKPYDFDGNRYADLAIGAPTLRVNKVRRAGGVVVLPASKSGPSLREKVITQSSRGVPGGSETDDQFGFAVASADFNRDGFADLAVGQPGETVGTASEAGMVTVVYGSRKGLVTTRSVTIGQPGGARWGLGWGYSLAAADLNADGYPDLAVGAPSPGSGGSFEGSVGVLPGGPRGLGKQPISVLTGQPEGPEYGDGDSMFGSSLATGDVDGDKDIDLVVLSAGDGTEGNSYAGSVTVCLAGSGRLAGCRRLVHDGFHDGLTAVAVGNMSGDRLPEIVVGSLSWNDVDPFEGAVTILHLRTAGNLSVAKLTELGQGSRGVPGADDEGDDAFGYDLALGDIDRDGWADLVVGGPGQSRERGRVTVIHGAASGWRTTGNYTFTQSTRGIPGKAERGDWFGSTVTLLDHNRDGRLDLTIGAFGENRGSGAVTTLPGSGKRFSTSRSRTFGLSRLGYRYPTGAEFGASLGR
jgi:hypothetical protein